VTPSISVSDPPRRPTGRCLALGRGPGLWPPSAVGTLVERHSRYVLLFPLPEGVTAHQARPALTAAVLGLPEQLRRSLTWDQGREMAEHIQFTIDSGAALLRGGHPAGMTPLA
jgi:hypothetical protein